MTRLFICISASLDHLAQRVACRSTKCTAVCGLKICTAFVFFWYSGTSLYSLGNCFGQMKMKRCAGKLSFSETKLTETIILIIIITLVI